MLARGPFFGPESGTIFLSNLQGPVVTFAGLLGSWLEIGGQPAAVPPALRAQRAPGRDCGSGGVPLGLEEGRGVSNMKFPLAAVRVGSAAGGECAQAGASRSSQRPDGLVNVRVLYVITASSSSICASGFFYTSLWVCLRVMLR